MSTPSPITESDEFYQSETYTQAFCVGRLIRKVFNSILSQADEELAAFGLTYAQWFPLFHLSKTNSCTVLGLAKEIEVNPGALTRSLDRLEKKGLILRERNLLDKRVVQLTLTPQGKEIAARVPQVLSGVMNRHLSGLDRLSSQALIDSLQQMLISGQRQAKQHNVQPLFDTAFTS
jgi:DNA-binding MarR family transcriptional regulator